MIPSTGGLLQKGFRIARQPGLTWQMQEEGSRVRGYMDGLEAVRQAAHKILMTERYRYLIYSWNYGVELEGLFGQPLTYVCPELKRRITQALLMDDRISSVDDFTYAFPGKGIVHTAFTIHTIYGDLREEKEVNI